MLVVSELFLQTLSLGAEAVSVLQHSLGHVAPQLCAPPSRSHELGLYFDTQSVGLGDSLLGLRRADVGVMAGSDTSASRAPSLPLSKISWPALKPPVE